MNCIDFIQRVILLCYKHKGSISSWGRTPKHNSDVGGVKNSWHQLWLGCDVILDEMIRNQVFENDAKVLEINAIMEGTHYHLQPLTLAQKGVNYHGKS